MTAELGVWSVTKLSAVSVCVEVGKRNTDIIKSVSPDWNAHYSVVSVHGAA